MKIPKQLKVSPLTYEVTIDDNVTNEADLFGSTHHRTQRIFIDKSLNQDHKEETFIHELIHAVMEVSGLRLFFSDQVVLTEEQVVKSLAMILTNVIKDNPEVFKP